MSDQRQASVKQVQFVEVLEQRSGDKYSGVRWLSSDVSSFIEQHTKKKNNNETNSNNFKASNPFENNNQQHSSNKITDKQRQYIKVLENKTGAFFSGKTFEDAEKYILEHKG